MIKRIVFQLKLIYSSLKRGYRIVIFRLRFLSRGKKQLENSGGYDFSLEKQLILKEWPRSVCWIGNNEQQDSTSVLPALKRMFRDRLTVMMSNSNNEKFYGCQADDLTRDNKEFILDRSNRAVEQFFRSNKYDLVISQVMTDYVSDSSLEKIFSSSSFWINIALDESLYYDGFSGGALGVANYANLTAVTSFKAVQRFNSHGFKGRVRYVTLGAEPEIFYKSASCVRDIDVLFVGNIYGYRIPLLSYLKSKGIEVTSYGNNSPMGPIRGELVPDLYKNAKIILGCGYYGNTKCATQKFRDYEAPLSGAYYITSFCDELMKAYPEGSIGLYRSMHEASCLIKVALRDNIKRIQQAQAAQVKAAQSYTWETFFKQLISAH